MEWPLSEPAKGSRDMLGVEGTCMGLQRQQEVFKKKVAGGWDTGVSVLQGLNPLQVPNKEKKGQRAAGGRVRGWHWTTCRLKPSSATFRGVSLGESLHFSDLYISI